MSRDVSISRVSCVHPPCAALREEPSEGFGRVWKSTTHALEVTATALPVGITALTLGVESAPTARCHSALRSVLDESMRLCALRACWQL